MVEVPQRLAGCKILFEKLGDQRREQASLMTKMQGSPPPLLSACRAVVRGLPCMLVIGEAALVADLITGLIFRHLERNLTARMDLKAYFS